MVTHECPAGIEHDFPPPPWWAQADLRRNDAHRALLREVVLATRPRWHAYQGKPITNAIRAITGPG